MSLRATAAVAAAGLGLLLAAGECRADAPQPALTYVFPAGGRPGSSVDVTIVGQDMAGAVEARLAPAGLTVKLNKTAAKQASLTITIPAEAAVGQYDLRLLSPGGASNRLLFDVGQLPELTPSSAATDHTKPLKIDSLPIVVNGQLQEGQRHYFALPAKAGHTLVAHADARSLIPFIADTVPGWFDACLTLWGPDGARLTSVNGSYADHDPTLTWDVKADGDYVLELKDIIDRGRADFVYRLSAGYLPYISRIYPLGGRRGTTLKLALSGANLGQTKLDLPLAADGPPLQPFHVEVGGLRSNEVLLAANTEPDVNEIKPHDTQATAQRLALPVAVNGRVDYPGEDDWYVFAVAAGQTITAEIVARRCGSPLDSIVAIYNKQGNKLAENDDAFDPSLPLLTHHADSRLIYKFGAAGDYWIRVRDVEGHGGSDYSYRLVLTGAVPDFFLRAAPDNPRVARGDTVMLNVMAVKRDGFDAPISLAVGGLPHGVVVTPTIIPAGADSALLPISVPLDGAAGRLAPIIIGTAAVDGISLSRMARGSETQIQAFSVTHYPLTRELLMTVIDSGGFSLAAVDPPPNPLEVPVGGSVDVKVKVTRQPAAKGPLTIHAAAFTNGFTIKPVTLAADQDQIAVTIAVPATVKDPLKATLVLQATGKVDKDAVTRSMPPIYLKVLVPPPADAAAPAVKT
jgi:hypothetical protein